MQGVVSVAVEFVSGDREGCHFAIADFDSGRVAAGVEGGGHGEAGGGGGRSDQFEDGFVGIVRLTGLGCSIVARRCEPAWVGGCRTVVV